jgi:hypothetical protein
MAENEAIEISVLSGQTPQPSLFLLPGKATNPTSIGASGDWPVVADGVAPVHVFFAFDGTEIFVASAPNVAAVLAGKPLGTQWTKASVPCELRFAGACLVMRKVPRSSVVAPEGPLASTVHDGGALLKAAQRAVEVAMRVQGRSSGPPFDATSVMPGAPRQGGSTSGDPSPPSTLRMNDRPLSPFGSLPEAPRASFGSSPPVAEVARPPVAVLPSATPPQGEPAEAKGLKGYWQAASGVKRISLVLMPIALYLSYWALRDPPPAPPPSLIAATGASAHARGVPSASAAEAIPGAAPSATASTASATSTTGASPPTPTTSASPAASALPTASASASASASAAAAASSVPPSAATHAPRAAPPVLAKLPAGKHTADREAIDAVASGNFDQAVTRYDALAAAHPDATAYKEAARILADKSGHPR